MKRILDSVPRANLAVTLYAIVAWALIAFVTNGDAERVSFWLVCALAGLVLAVLLIEPVVRPGTTSMSSAFSIASAALLLAFVGNILISIGLSSDGWLAALLCSVVATVFIYSAAMDSHQRAEGAPVWDLVLQAIPAIGLLVTAVICGVSIVVFLFLAYQLGEDGDWA